MAAPAALAAAVAAVVVVRYAGYPDSGRNVAGDFLAAHFGACRSAQRYRFSAGHADGNGVRYGRYAVAEDGRAVGRSRSNLGFPSSCFRMLEEFLRWLRLWESSLRYLKMGILG